MTATTFTTHQSWPLTLPYRFVRTHSRSIGTSVQSCKPECPERHDNTILDGGKSGEPRDDSARDCHQVRRLVTGTAIRAGIVTIQNRHLVAHPLSILDQAQAIDADKPVRAGRNH